MDATDRSHHGNQTIRMSPKFPSSSCEAKRGDTRCPCADHLEPPTQSLDPPLRLAPEPRDSRWDPDTLPDDDDEDDEPRWTELQVASRNGDVHRVTEILSRCGDAAHRREVVNAPAVGWYGQTALQAACFHEHEEIVQLLLAAGANISAPGGNNIYQNAFEYACGTGKGAPVSPTYERVLPLARHRKGCLKLMSLSEGVKYRKYLHCPFAP